VRQAKKDGKIAILIGIEGGHAIEDSLGALSSFYRLGVRYMTLTHSFHLDWADSAGMGDQMPPGIGGHQEPTPFRLTAALPAGLQLPGGIDESA